MLDASHEILDECIRLGGSVTGEHGIGVEKIDFMPKLFTPDDLHYMVRLRTAFNPENRCSPARCCRRPAAAPSRRAVSRKRSRGDGPRCDTSAKTRC